jgi:hypothetical protein
MTIRCVKRISIYHCKLGIQLIVILKVLPKSKVYLCLNLCHKSSNNARKRQAKGYNRKIKGQKLVKGDTVLLKNVGLKGKNKLMDRWQQDPFIVIDQPNQDTPVYTVKRDRIKKNIHRNLLLPVLLPMEDIEPVTTERDRPPSRRQKEEIEFVQIVMTVISCFTYR